MQRQVLMLWLKQVFNNVWMHIPNEARVPFLMSDAVRPSMEVLNAFYQDRGIAFAQAS